MPNNSTSRFARTSFAGSPSGAGLRLFVGDFNLEIPISQFAMTYGINAIPTAAAHVALGKNARTRVPSAIQDIASTLKEMMKVTVTLNGKLGDWSPDGGGTAGGKSQYKTADNNILFMGYLSGTAYRRSNGNLTLVLNLIQKSVDLTMSSAGSEDVIPGSPSSLMLPTLLKGTGSDKRAGTARGRFTEQLTDDIQVDFSDGIIKVLAFLAKENQIQVHGKDSEVAGWCSGVSAPGDISKPDSNDAVLEYFSGDGLDWLGVSNFGGLPEGEVDGPGVEDGLTEPYKFTPEVSKALVANSISGTISRTMSTVSMWDLLVSRLLPQFGMAFVPFAQRSAIVPVLPMAKFPSVTIFPNEYGDISLSAASTRPLYAVGIMSSYNTATFDSSENKQCVGAFFVPQIAEGDDAGSDAVKSGQWMFQEAPEWLKDFNNFDEKIIDGDPDVVALLEKPSADAIGDNKEALAGRNPDDEVDDINDAMKSYAKWVYCANALRSRSGSVTGKFRLDIGPGAVVKIAADQLDQPQFTDGVDSLAESLIGFVTRVTTNVDAERGAANTTFEFTHLRTESENNDPASTDRFSMTEHPFFDKFYRGGYLVEQFKEPKQEAEE